MDGDDFQPLVDELARLPADELFNVYLNLVEETPEKAQLPALALREKARAGKLGDDDVPMLEACLICAPDLSCVMHLAKALAAHGRKAQSAAAALCARVRLMRVTDDLTYWGLDGCVWALGYLGGDEARELVEELRAEEPPRVVAQVGYEGEVSAAHRKKHWAKTLTQVRALIDGADPGPWRSKKTTLTARAAAGPETVSW